ncbi:MAG: PEP-CTERM sorting domain-containing protein [Phycisphaeraceae bacterium]|nr:PEP-CTERM sorting domain-containing protein [Phycisphaeraceae bacterium]
MSRALKMSVPVILCVVAQAWAMPTSVVVEDTPRQDPLVLPQLVDELGNMPPFPPDEWITSSDVLTPYIPCPVDYEPGGPPNVLVSITNMTPTFWTELHYVADPDTLLTNDDGFINGGLAFRIDYGGLNTPLVFESFAPDMIFAPGETWEFVIQNYMSPWGGPASAFTSIGVGGFSPAGPPSTGSIIALVVPEPASLILLAGGMLLLTRRSPRCD